MSLLHASKKSADINMLFVHGCTLYQTKEGKSNFLPCSSMSHSFSLQERGTIFKEDFLKYITGTQNPSMKSYSFTVLQLFPPLIPLIFAHLLDILLHIWKSIYKKFTFCYQITFYIFFPSFVFTSKYI